MTTRVKKKIINEIRIMFERKSEQVVQKNVFWGFLDFDNDQIKKFTNQLSIYGEISKNNSKMSFGFDLTRWMSDVLVMSSTFIMGLRFNYQNYMSTCIPYLLGQWLKNFYFSNKLIVTYDRLIQLFESKAWGMMTKTQSR